MTRTNICVLISAGRRRRGDVLGFLLDILFEEVIRFSNVHLKVLAYVALRIAVNVLLSLHDCVEYRNCFSDLIFKVLSQRYVYVFD